MKNSNITTHKSAYFFKRLKKFPIIVSFSDREFDLGFKQGIKNRKKFLNNIGINHRDLVCLKQPHRSKVVGVTRSHRGKGALSYRSAISGDGLVSNENRVPLAVFTADCLSIFLFCPKTKTIGLIHSGWRGTKANIAKKAIFIMEKKFNCRPKDIIVCFGPAIRQCCYEVGKDFKKNFKKGLIKRDGKFFLDLAKINKTQLISSGVKKKNIIDSRICTSCENKKFFSYRKEKNKTGRIMSVIMLK
ncbi:MAG: peptidoglycan editing factor PgeF [Candidatus Omnitrophota bacterium]